MRELPSCQRPRAKFAKRTQFSEWNQHLAAPALAAPAVTGGATEGNRLGPERLPLIGGGISEILIYPPDQLALAGSRFRRLGIFRGEIGKDGRRRPERAIGDLVHDQDAATNNQGVKEQRRHPVVEAAAAPYRRADDALDRAILAEDHDIDLALDDVEGLALGSNPSGLLHWASGEDHVEG
jgi:hypothetical protein